MSGVLLAIDFGQSWCKAAWLDQSGEVRSDGRARTRGLPGFAFSAAEGDRIWDRLVEAVRAADAPGPCEAIAISSRIGLGVWLDDADHPIELPERAPLEAGDHEMDVVYRAEGWGESLGTYAPMLVARTRWLRRQHGTAFGRVRRVGALHDYLLLRLTDRWATNPATGPDAEAWPPAAAALTGLPLAAFPDVLGFGQVVAGGLSVGAASDLGLRAGTPVAAGYHDGAAATAGTDCLAPGDTCVTLGTSVAIRVVTDRRPTKWFRYPIAEGRWAWMRGLELAMAQLDAVASELGGSTAQLTKLAASEPAGARGIRLAPLPPTEASRRGEVVRRLVADGHSSGLVYRAALEGIAFGIVQLVAQARAAGLAPSRFILTGGGASNPLLVRMLAAVLDGEVSIGEVEAGIRGVGLAAAVAAGWHGSIVEAAATMLGRPVALHARPDDRPAYAPLVADLPHPVDPWEPRPYWRALAT